MTPQEFRQKFELPPGFSTFDEQYVHNGKHTLRQKSLENHKDCWNTLLNVPMTFRQYTYGLSGGGGAELLMD